MAARVIPEWLKETRLRQVMPNGESWTQDYLIARMQEAIGWAPYRSNYSKYETGKATPERETLGRFVQFWAGMGEPGPDLNRKADAEPGSDVDRLVVALAAQTGLITELIGELRQSRREAADLMERIEALEAAAKLQGRSGGETGAVPDARRVTAG